MKTDEEIQEQLTASLFMLSAGLPDASRYYEAGYLYALRWVMGDRPDFDGLADWNTNAN